MRQLSTTHTKHSVFHICREWPRKDDTEILKDYPYDVVLSSSFAFAPMNREELKAIADFIYFVLDKDDSNQTV
jgi:hypothetical protein